MDMTTSKALVKAPIRWESIHTWPEDQFVSLDIFVCGDCDPWLAVPVLEQWFKPTKSVVEQHLRGRSPAARIDSATKSTIIKPETTSFKWVHSQSADLMGVK